MTQFFKTKKKYDPTTEAIKDTFSKTYKKVTPTEVANYLNIHPTTAKKKILNLQKDGYVVCKPSGKKLICERGRKLKDD